MTQEHIQHSIDNAVAGKSSIDQEVLNVRGFSTKTIRELFHGLCNIGQPITYFEIGLFCGATFCASFNKETTCIGVENHSQDFSEGFEKVKQELKDNVDKFANLANEIQVHYVDCFSMDKSTLPDNIGIYFYDGFHGLEEQEKAITHFFDKMASTFILIVDDAAWSYVAEGTKNGLNKLSDKIEVVKSWKMRGHYENNDPIWHNGVDIYLINKK